MLATTRIIDILEEAKMEPSQAKAIARVIEESHFESKSDYRQEVDLRLKDVATKADVAVLKTDIAELKAEIMLVESRLIRWVVAMLISQALVLLGGMVFIISHASNLNSH